MPSDQTPDESKRDGAWRPPSDAKRKRLQQCFEHASKMMAQDNFDYATELLTQCVSGDPSSFLYLQAFLGNLKKKYNNNKKGSNMAFIKGGSARRAVSKAAGQKDWEGVVKSGVEALKLNPWDVSTLTAMADAVKQMGFDEVELAYLKTALEANTNEPSICKLCAKALAERRQFDQAIALLHRVEKLKPDDEEVQRTIASLAVEKTLHEADWEKGGGNKKPKAPGAPAQQNAPVVEMSPTQRLEREIARKPDDLAKYVELAELYLQDDLFDRAEEVLSKAYEVSNGDPDVRERWEDAQVRRLRAQIIQADRQAKAGNAKAAAQVKELQKELNRKELEVYKNRCERYTNNLVYKYELGVRYQRNGMFSEAIGEFQQAQRDPRRKGLCMLALGQCFQKINQYPLAMKHFEQAIEDIPDREADNKKRALYLAGRLALELKDFDVADRHLTRLAALDYAYRDVADMLKNLPKLREQAERERPAQDDE